MNGPTKIRIRFAVFVSLAFLAAGLVGLSTADDPEPKPKPPDKPRVEDEDPDAKPAKTHKVTVDDTEEPGPKTAAAPRAVDLAQAARDAKHFAVKKLFRDLAVPHDLLKYNQFNHNHSQNIVPIPDYIGKKTEAIVEPLDVTPFAATSWTPDAPIKVKKNTVEYITPYEELARDAVDNFLKTGYEKSADLQVFLSRYDQDVAAEQALTAALLHLQSDMQRGARSNKDDAWPRLEESLKEKLLGVLLDQLNVLVAQGDWDAAFALTKRLAATYRTSDDQKSIAVPLVGLVKQALALSLDDKQKAEARRRLRQLEDLFPDNPAIQPVTEALRQQARDLFAEAKKEMDDPKNKVHVGMLLNEAEDAWPALPELRNTRLKLSNEHPILRVGVRELPARMSPALSASDSDLRAVELQFESLMKLAPDGAGGGRWEPGLADARPQMTPHGRLFTLPSGACWSNGRRLTAGDVRYTVNNLIQGGRVPLRPAVWGGLLDKVAVGDPAQVSLTLPQGWLDPLALMNFKVSPTPDPDTPEPDSEKFAAHPLGSGPFVYAENIRTDNGRSCVAFTANPYYGARRGKAGLPRIEEIHFILYKDPAEELAAGKVGRLDLILDLTAKEADSLKARPDLHVAVPASPNRRIYFLAVNHRKPSLANAAFRCSLAYAINRDRLLDDAFRAAPGQELHTPLNGPYPAKAWASDPKMAKKHDDKVTLDPFDPLTARAKKTESGVADVTLTLKYATGDPAVEKAMGRLAAQVKEEIGVTLTPIGLSPDALRNAVEGTHDYDLAYYHYDFPDDVYWLGPLLDPAAGTDRENYMGYKGVGKDGLNPMIQDAGRRRDFPQVREYTHLLHDKFLNAEMPFIPLWQLDPQVVLHTDVVAPTFDPLLVFTDVERWKLNRK